MNKRHLMRIAGVLVGLLGLTACNINNPALFPTVIVTIPATNTLAPVVTSTQRFTATPIPSPTPLNSPTPPSEETPTLPPTFVDPPTPTPTATALIKAVIKADSGQVNMRSGPGTTFRIVGTLKGNSPLLVISYSEDSKWSLVRLDDGTEGWILANLVTLANPSATVPVLAAAELTQRAQLGTTIAQTATALIPTAEGTVGINAAAATHQPRIQSGTDVLAYCDQRSDAARNRKFTQGQPIYIFWSWIAKTPEQMKDHLNNANYNVKINGQVLGDWGQYSTKVIPQTNGTYITYWFVPIGTPAPGNYKIEFNLTWKAAINDGTDNYGPGTDKPTDTGTCSFSVVGTAK
jgi:uncharacterized protein YgiM (DUF1202 family)